MSASDDSAAEVQAMVARARVFLHENPGLRASVQFNFPSGVFQVATIQQGLAAHIINANAGGLQLLEAVQLGAAAEPTVLMLRAALAAVGLDSGG